jgi:hypothetical protein
MLMPFVAGLLIASRTSAQVPAAAPSGREARRPQDGVFVQAPAAVPDHPALVLEASGYGGYDDNLTALAAGGGDITARVPGEFAAAHGALEYDRIGRRAAISLGGQSTLRYYSTGGNANALDAGLSAAVDANLTQRWSLRASEQAGYTSFYQLVPLVALGNPL